jgi:hypothetical protein
MYEKFDEELGGMNYLKFATVGYVVTIGIWMHLWKA